MENGDRRVPGKLARRAAHLYGLSLIVLPVETDWSEPPQCEGKDVAACLAGLGYPGLAYLRPAKKKNPAEVLFAALNCDELESRLTEALPWVVLEYPDLDWNWLVTAAKTHNLQNRLGFVTSVSRRLAEVDVLSIVLASQRAFILELAGRGSPLHKKYRLHIECVTVAAIPEDYEQRLTEMFPGSFSYLRLLALDPYDVALSKLERNSQRDRDDVKFLAEKVPFDLEVQRYEKELRPNLGNPKREDLTIQLWIDAITEQRGRQQV